MTGTLNGKIALVTGGRGGIGRAICARFAKEGASVYAGDLSEAGSLADDAAPAQGTFLRFDVTDEASVASAFAAIEATHGKLDILVNAAGKEIEKTPLGSPRTAQPRAQFTR
jgi:NAD(P)-dependent dehydrogenase (short-subunit alcohol dehydrogenase family)